MATTDWAALARLRSRFSSITRALPYGQRETVARGYRHGWEQARAQWLGKPSNEAPATYEQSHAQALYNLGARVGESHFALTMVVAPDRQEHAAEVPCPIDVEPTVGLSKVGSAA